MTFELKMLIGVALLVVSAAGCGQLLSESEVRETFENKPNQNAQMTHDNNLFYFLDL